MLQLGKYEARRVKGHGGMGGMLVLRQYTGSS